MSLHVSERRRCYGVLPCGYPSSKGSATLGDLCQPAHARLQKIFAYLCPSVAQSAPAASFRTSRFGLNEKLTAVLAGIPGILIGGRNLAIV